MLREECYEMASEAFRKSWEVARIRMFVGIMYSGEDAWTEYEVILPPGVVIGPANSGATYDVLFCRPPVKFAVYFVKTMRSMASHSFTERGMDSGSANVRLVAWEAMQVVTCPYSLDWSVLSLEGLAVRNTCSSGVVARAEANKLKGSSSSQFRSEG